MLVSRIGKAVLGLLFVWLFLLNADGCFAANKASTIKTTSDEKTEVIPTPSPEVTPSESASESDEDVGQCYGGDECSICGNQMCSPPGRFWVRSDWLMWWAAPAHIPALVTTGPALGNPPLDPSGGVLGVNGTQILYGNSSINQGGRSGVKTTIGAWLDCCHTWGLEGDWLSLGGLSSHYFNNSYGSPLLARPFYDVSLGANNAELTAYANPDPIFTGSINIDSNDYFDSVGVALRYNLCCNSCRDECCDSGCDGSCGSACGGVDSRCMYYCRTDLVVGFRRYTLDDNLTIFENTTDNRTDSNFQITDSFRTTNNFYGSEIGLNTEMRSGRWSLDILTKLAIGNNHQTTYIDGKTVISQPGVPSVTQYSGILAVQPNIGAHPDDRFTFIPQFSTELGYQLTCHWRAYLGYSILYWGSVLRAGDQIDTNIDPRNWPSGLSPSPTPGSALPFPAYLARTTGFWAQGINLGAEFRF
jgi:hypothetical protein